MRAISRFNKTPYSMAHIQTYTFSFTSHALVGTVSNYKEMEEKIVKNEFKQFGCVKKGFQIKLELQFCANCALEPPKPLNHERDQFIDRWLNCTLSVWISYLVHRFEAVVRICQDWVTNYNYCKWCKFSLINSSRNNLISI